MTIQSERFLPRKRMQDVDRVAEVQVLSQPPWHRGPRVYGKSFGLVSRPQNLRRIARHLGGHWNLRQDSAIRPTES